MSVDAAARAYARFFDELAPGNTGELRRLARADLRFKDPFNDLRGVERVVGLFDHMFEATVSPRFETGAVATSGASALIRWQFTCTFATRLLPGCTMIDGVSEVRFDASELVADHVDYWDPAEHVYGRLPLLGGLLRLMRSRLAYPG